MSQEWDYKQVKVPNVGQPLKAQERAIQKVAAQGWELVNVRTGGGWTKDTATFRRRKPVRTSRPSLWGTGKHTHSWVDASTPDDARNGVRFETCDCGASQTVST